MLHGTKTALLVLFATVNLLDLEQVSMNTKENPTAQPITGNKLLPSAQDVANPCLECTCLWETRATTKIASLVIAARNLSLVVSTRRVAKLFVKVACNYNLNKLWRPLRSFAL